MQDNIIDGTESFGKFVRGRITTCMKGLLVMTRVCVRSQHGYEFFETEDILFFQKVSKDVVIHLPNRKVHVRMTLKQASMAFASPEFFPAHKSFVVNLNKVSRISPGIGGTFVVCFGVFPETVPLSRKNLKKLLSRDPRPLLVKV